MQERKPPLARRTVLGGAATAGAAAVVASLVPLSPRPASPVTPAVPGTPETPLGYQLTDHVKNYYAKARV